jgi:hypothetical protein
VLQFKEAWPAFAREPQAVGGALPPTSAMRLQGGLPVGWTVLSQTWHFLGIFPEGRAQPIPLVMQREK